MNPMKLVHTHNELLKKELNVLDAPEDQKEEMEKRKLATILAMRAREAAQSVEQFGTAVIEMDNLIPPDQISLMGPTLREYAVWLDRIAAGEPITAMELAAAEAMINSVQIAKPATRVNTYKRDIIEVIYVQTDSDTGKATRHKLAEVPHSGGLLKGDTLVLDEIRVGFNGYGNRLPSAKPQSAWLADAKFATNVVDGY